MARDKYAKYRGYETAADRRSRIQLRVGITALVITIVGILIATSIAILQNSSSTYRKDAQECADRLRTVAEKAAAVDMISLRTKDDPDKVAGLIKEYNEFVTADDKARAICPMTEIEYISVRHYSRYKLAADATKECGATALGQGTVACDAAELHENFQTVATCSRFMATLADDVQHWSTLKNWCEVISRWENPDSEIDSESSPPGTIQKACGMDAP